MHHDHSLLDVISHCQSQSVSQSPSTSPQQHASTSSPNAATTSSDKRKSPDNRYYEHCTAAVDLSDALHSVYIVTLYMMLARHSQDHYILPMFFIFSSPDFWTFFNRYFRNFATWRGSSFNKTFAIGLPLRCHLEQMRGQNPKFCRFSDRTVTHLAPPFLNGEETQKSKTNVNRWLLYTVTQIWWSSGHKQRASLHVGTEDFATFGKYGVISRKRHKIGIQLLWRTYRKS